MELFLLRFGQLGFQLLYSLLEPSVIQKKVAESVASEKRSLLFLENRSGHSWQWQGRLH